MSTSQLMLIGAHLLLWLFSNMPHLLPAVQQNNSSKSLAWRVHNDAPSDSTQPPSPGRLDLWVTSHFIHIRCYLLLVLQMLLSLSMVMTTLKCDKCMFFNDYLLDKRLHIGGGCKVPINLHWDITKITALWFSRCVTFCCPNTSSHSMFLEMLCACCVEIVCYIFISLHWIGSLMLGSYLDALANNLSLSLYIYTHTCIHKKLSRSFLIFSFFFFLGVFFLLHHFAEFVKAANFIIIIILSVADKWNGL